MIEWIISDIYNCSKQSEVVHWDATVSSYGIGEAKSTSDFTHISVEPLRSPQNKQICLIHFTTNLCQAWETKCCFHVKNTSFNPCEQSLSTIHHH